MKRETDHLTRSEDACMNRPNLIGIRVFVLVLLALATPARAQSQVTLLNATGYGSLGFATGLALTAGAECSGFVCVPPEMVIASLAGGLTGIIVGAKIARRAEREMEAGEPVSHLGALSVGTVLGGGVLGLVAGGILIGETGDQFGEGTLFGSDEQTITIFGLAGAGLGVLLLRSRWGDMTGGTLEVRPAIVGGEAGVTARIRF